MNDLPGREQVSQVDVESVGLKWKVSCPFNVFCSLSKGPFFDGSFPSASLQGFEGEKLRPRGGSSTHKLQLGIAGTGLQERLVS